MSKEKKIELADPKNSFTRPETGSVIVISLIIALRLLGIFLMLPIFSAYAVRYPGATLPLAGLAFGIYALFQSLFQIPMGWASDRWGRKPLLILGLSIFTVGSLGCGLAQDVAQLIIARAIQGSGAVGSVAVAALADSTRSNVRAQAFTITGIAIGAAFMLGLLAGPVLAAHMGLSGLFYILAVLGALAVVTAALFFPNIERWQQQELTNGPWKTLHDTELRSIYLAGFFLSFALNLFFFTYPLSWTNLGVEKSQLWEIYLIIFIPSLLVVFPYVRFAEKHGRLQPLVRVGWVSMAGGLFAYLIGTTQEWLLYVSGAILFLGYSLFQPLLSSFLTERTPQEGRGAATGLYGFAGFLGSALGGMMGGVLGHFGPSPAVAAGLILMLVWVLLGLPNPPDPPA
ncbi:MAG: MFS transporter [Candidatus Binatia bacterium]